MFIALDEYDGQLNFREIDFSVFMIKKQPVPDRVLPRIIILPFNLGLDSKDMSYKDLHWHEECFKCRKCKDSLVEKPFAGKNL